MSTTRWTCAFALTAALVCGATTSDAATIFVAGGGDLQAALDAAKPGDTILLAESQEFVGNFVLPVKTGSGWITIRTAAPDSFLPPAGRRIKPTDAPHLARLRSPNWDAALRTAPGAHHWDIRYLEFAANAEGYGDLIQIGDGSTAQNTLDKVPHDLVLNHLYVHGHPFYGQKRCISLNAASVTITDSFIADCKGVGMDTQAIAGWNGPGPYLIENNYLEGAGENVMFGGADPAITNLVADGVTIRRNHFSRPMSWRQPILGPVSGVTATGEGGGSLAAGVYAYRVVAYGYVGQAVIGRSTASAEVVATLNSGGAVRIRWQPVAGATEYRVYGRAAGSQSTYWRVTTTAFVDSGLAGTSEAVPTTAGTVWSVKNLFELKSARNVVLEANIFENHWREAQPGYAIVLTPRNSGGKCTWCVVEHVRFEYNLIQNVSGGFNMIGYDNVRPTRQTNDIVIRHNVLRMSTSLGSNGWFLLMGDGPRDITIEHNTIDSNGNTVLNVYGGTSADPKEVWGFRFVGNAARHGTYGINGAFFTYGNAIINAFLPDGVITGNYLAGGNSSKYPSGNLFTPPFEAQFVDSANGDYTVLGSSPLKGFAPGGTDVGADMAELTTRLIGVRGGTPPAPPIADFGSACTTLSCVFTDASVGVSGPIVSRSWDFGDTTSGSGSPVTHAFGASGTFLVKLTVTDDRGLSSWTTKPITLESSNVPPTASFTSSCRDLVCNFSDTSSDTDGQVTAVSWDFGDGGLSNAPQPVYTYGAVGTHDVSITAIDDDGAAATKTVPVNVRALLHGAFRSANTKRWMLNSVNYWSTDITVEVHGANERPIAGATITAAWSGALVKNVSCVTSAAGVCTFKSGTLSWLRNWVTLTVANVAAPISDYDVTAAHNQIGSGSNTAATINKPQ